MGMGGEPLLDSSCTDDLVVVCRFVLCCCSIPTTGGGFVVPKEKDDDTELGGGGAAAAGRLRNAVGRNAIVVPAFPNAPTNDMDLRPVFVLLLLLLVSSAG